MVTIKEAGKTAQANIIGLALGAVAGYYIAKKAVKVENKYALVGMVVVGAVVGVMAQSKMTAKKASVAIAVEAKK